MSEVDYLEFMYMRCQGESVGAAADFAVGSVLCDQKECLIEATLRRCLAFQALSLFSKALGSTVCCNA